MAKRGRGSLSAILCNQMRPRVGARGGRTPGGRLVARRGRGCAWRWGDATTDHSPTVHRPFTDNSPTIHRPFTDHLATIHWPLTEIKSFFIPRRMLGDFSAQFTRQERIIRLRSRFGKLFVPKTLLDEFWPWVPVGPRMLTFCFGAGCMGITKAKMNQN